MIKVEQMGVSPSQAKGKEGDHDFLDESTSQQSHEIDTEYLLTELPENKNQCGPAITQNESADIDTGEHNHTQSFCPQEIVQRKTLEHKHQHGSENNPEESCTWVCDLPVKPSKSFSKGLSENPTSTDTVAFSPEDFSKYTHSNKLSCPQQGSAETTVGSEFENTCKELSESREQVQHVDSESLPTSIEDTNKRDHGKRLQLLSEEANNVIQSTRSALVDPLGLPQEVASEDPSIQQPGLNCEDMVKISGAEQHKSSNDFGQSNDEETSKMTKNYMLRSLTSNDKVLALNSQEKSKPSEPSNNLADVGPSEQRRGRKKKRGKQEVADEYSRIRGHLRYFLNRINYERSLILAYSADGWKGLSQEKLKPETELQRATSEILRRKLKIRDLFQRMDSLCAEGRLPESLFDSDGQIDSEDIFCAKCGSKDLSPDNDIILCDGACDRGFHQYCLQPPLLKEDIPPDDEGWLCPGCNCKVDCIELLNESQGTSFSLTDNWEKVFPEAAVSTDGENVDPNFGLPSDDSDDNDYNLDDNDYDPDDSETDKKHQGKESSPDESELPGNRVSSSSDFTSDSEDLGSMSEDDISSEKDEDPMSEHGGKESLNDELLSIMESASGQDGAFVSEKRGNERLDYKRLYDETYGDVPSSSSDDEDWSDAAAPRKRLKCTVEAASTSLNGKASKHVVVTVSGSGGKKPSSSTQRRLGEAVKQRLYESFKENQYPDRSTKESLAKELEITFQQVSKWFCNARRSSNNSASIHETSAKRVSENDIPVAPNENLEDTEIQDNSKSSDGVIQAPDLDSKS
ncbi:hypothetical protein HRI_003725000 [Hibiscus trionum]|uniref:Uncharacterized protein n=1 Tax=Hibiscus trionum TaxID=183268 RepID=A0A9W7IPZ0_HIBTR|nr:hypothetical protein HRI_003725000 [Hibiscus trionum]